VPDRCCLPNYDLTFDAEEARRELIRYRSAGPESSTQRLIDALVAHGVAGARLLDIGGGVGAVQHALLAAGADRALDVDASSAYLAAAEGEARDRGLRDRIDYLHGDFVAVADEVEPAEIVTLDRVICCYPDVRALVGASAARATRLYGLVYPVDRWWTRLAVGIGNLWCRVRRRDYRAYVHPQRLVDEVVQSAGLVLARRQRSAFWQMDVFVRPQAAG
jgi:magnesium-protoporphyrin O-methyltransferase